MHTIWVDSYDPTLIGQRLAWGRSHSVYRYGEHEVIKIPFLEYVMWPKLQERLERDISASQKYFGEFFLSTRIVEHPKTRAIATIQPFIVGHYLSKEDVRHPAGKQTFEKFMACYDAMYADGVAPLDLVGQGGVLERKLSNVMVLSDGSWKIYDAAILDLFGFEWWNWLARGVIWAVLRRQEGTIQYFRS